MSKLRRFKTVLSIAERASSLLSNITNASHPMAWVGVGMNVVSQVADLIPEDLDLQRAWKHVDHATSDAVCQVLMNACVGDVKAVKNLTTYYQHKGAIWSVEDHKAHGPYGDAEALPAEIWEILGNYIQMDVEFNRVSYNLEINLLRDEPPPTYAVTETGQRILDEIQAKRAHNHPVGVLLHGPAGTGKTSILCAIAQQLNAKVLIGSSHDPFRTLGMVRVLKPDMVIFEDVCRSMVSDATLKAFANLVDSGVLVMATANHPDKIDQALLRPGRLGMHYCIAQADSSTIRGMLQDSKIEVLEDWERFEKLTLAELVSWISDHQSLGRDRAWDVFECRRAAFRKWSGEDAEKSDAEAPPSPPDAPETVG